MGEFRMPSLGADMEAGTLVEWKVAPGQRVKRGDIIAVVETQKGAIEVEVFEDGVVQRLVVPPGQEVPVGSVLAVLGEGEVQPAAAAPPAPPPAARAPEAPAPAAPPAARPAARPPAPGRVRASPVARRRAAELGVDLAQVQGSGPGGAIALEDVERAAAHRAPAPAPQDAMRRAIAAAMARSKREIPHYYLSTTVDMGAALAWLEEENRRRSLAERLLPVVLLLKATALALREVPGFNGTWVDGGFRPSTPVHLGVAIALRQGGLVAPALHDADRQPLGGLMQQLSDLIRRVRAGSVRSSELTDPTATVTPLSEPGAEAVFGIIYPPQVALVGFGRVVERPAVVGGQVVPRPQLTATLAADHRVSDGHQGARLLAAVERLLQAPERL